jgi:ketosteroid isomerase-like protein
MGVRLAGVLVAALAVLTLAGAIAPPGPATAQEDPVAVVEALIEEFNASVPTGDGAAIAAHFTEDGSFTNLEGGESFGVFGRPAMEIAFSEEPDPQFSVTVVEIAATDGQVTGTVEFRDGSTVDAGIERGISDFTAVVVDGKVASLNVVDDLSDPQTAQLADFVASQPDEGDEDEGPPSEDFVEVRMTGDQGGEESGAFVGAFGDGVVGLFVGIEPGPEGVLQPSGIHEGTCDDLGELAQQLAPVWNGAAGSIFSVDFDQLLAEPHAIAVAASEDNTDTVVACANIERAAEVVLPKTGTGNADGTINFDWLTALLASAGLAAVAGAGALRLRRR